MRAYVYKARNLCVVESGKSGHRRPGPSAVDASEMFVWQLRYMCTIADPAEVNSVWLTFRLVLTGSCCPRKA